MARVVISPLAEKQINECRAFYEDGAIGIRAVKIILSAFRRLARHPAMGRPVPEDPSLRELVIPFGHYGYVALYEFVPRARTIVILAVRHQRQAGYNRGMDNT
jgi:plasmid stabilization system protein ParE